MLGICFFHTEVGKQDGDTDAEDQRDPKVENVQHAYGMGALNGGVFNVSCASQQPAGNGGADTSA